LFASSNALAQDPPDEPCCWLAPSATAFHSSDIQPLTNANDVAIDIHANATEVPEPGQSVFATLGKAIEMPAAIEESWTPNYRR
jgi:hypothetical protein